MAVPDWVIHLKDDDEFCLHLLDTDDVVWAKVISIDIFGIYVQFDKSQDEDDLMCSKFLHYVEYGKDGNWIGYGVG